MIKDEFLQEITNETHKTNNLRVSMLRLDKLHPVVSGNKLFKLKYHLTEANQLGKKSIVTMGGPYSNHLVATAYTSQQAGIASVGLVRGYQPSVFSDTLKDCIAYGMELNFLSKEEFEHINSHYIEKKYLGAYFIAHGGYGPLGVKGAEEILNFEGHHHFDYIMAACGTGTMGAGLVNASSPNQQIILISVLKNNFSIQQEIEHMIDEKSKVKNNLSINFDFHLGGYAKKDNLLFEAMNQFYSDNKIETDFVYTGKMIYAFNQLKENEYFKKNSSILLIHSGGLQGNRSLQNGELIYRL